MGDPAAQDQHRRATHAGSISYMFGQSYVVLCEASVPDSEGLVQVTCCNMAGIELAVLDMKACEDVTHLRGMVVKALSSELSDASCVLELVTPDGQLLNGGTSILDALVAK